MNAVANRRNIEVTKVAHLQGHKGAIYDFVIDKSTEMVYTAGADGVVAAWHADETNGTSILQTDEPIYSIALRNGRLKLGSQNGVIYTIDLESKQLLSKVKVHEGGIFFILDNLSGGEDGILSIDNTKIRISESSLRCLLELEHEWIIGSSDAKIYRISKSDFSVIGILEGHTNSVFGLTRVDDFTLISTGRDALIKAWDLKINKEVHSVPAHMYQAKSLDYNGDLLLSSSMDKTIKV
ncbi:MAG: hypothetical protein RLZZ337_1474, partial [Bacteroidota bacterium]